MTSQAVASIDLKFPCWEDYVEGLTVLESLIGLESGATMPNPNALQSLLSPAVTNREGQPIQLVAPSLLPDGNYEEHIFNTGRVSTRDNWHDVFNALVWSRFPKIKAAMNALHVREMRAQPSEGRGKLRDALTLWDECGVIVASSDMELLDHLAERNWNAAFRDRRHLWGDQADVFVCGHALLEKFLSPYKSNTANALLVHLDAVSENTRFQVDRATRRRFLDAALASKLMTGDLISTTADLSPLPLAGIPGWWANGDQDDAFYADDWVFRKPPKMFHPVSIVDIDVSLAVE